MNESINTLEQIITNKKTLPAMNKSIYKIIKEQILNTWKTYRNLLQNHFSQLYVDECLS